MTKITRRTFLTTLGGGAVGAAAVQGLLREPGSVEVTRHDVAVPDLPDGLRGLRVAAVTDLHLGSSRAAARATLAHLVRERPDIVVLVGDSCNTGAELSGLTAFSREARGQLATVAVYGNWEHGAFIRPRTLARAYQGADAQLLVNESVTLAHRGARLTIVGFDDPTAGAPDARSAALAEPGDARFWLVHSPGWVDRLPDLAADAPRPALILAGHTHGGQVRTPFWTPYTPAGSGRFVSGWYRDTLAPLYVSRGIGTTVLPARLFCPPELPIFTLRAS